MHLKNIAYWLFSNGFLSILGHNLSALGVLYKTF